VFWVKKTLEVNLLSGDKRNGWIDELRREIESAGGENGIERQHEAGKLTARERIEYLVDEGSFRELDAAAVHECHDLGMQEKKYLTDAVVTGYGLVGGRRVCVAAQDFTVLGGSLGHRHAEKICKVMDLAVKTGCPYIGLNDSGGARIQEGVSALGGYGDIFFRGVVTSGVVPMITAIMGPCAGGAAYSAAINDFVLIVKNTGKLFVTGPQVIKAVTGEEIDAEELGGAATHNSISGVAQFAAEDDRHCLDLIRALLGYMPSNNLETAPFADTGDDPERADSDLDALVPDDPKKAYDMREVISRVTDRDSFFEVQRHFAGNIIIGFCRMGGHVMGVVANQPAVSAGCLDINSSVKAARFVRTCDAFNIPILTFADVPGFLPGAAQEHGGIIRHGAKLLYAYCEATVPKITVITRKGYGGAYIVMGSRHAGADMVFGWPTAEIAVMGAEGAVNVIYRKEISDCGSEQEKAEKRKELIAEYTEKFASPKIAAQKGYIDELIKPSETRARVISAFAMTRNKREHRPGKRHGNIPL